MTRCSVVWKVLIRHVGGWREGKEGKGKEKKERKIGSVLRGNTSWIYLCK